MYSLWSILRRFRNVSVSYIPMHAFARLFTTDFIANDCRLFDWLGALKKPRWYTSAFVSYELGLWRITGTVRQLSLSLFLFFPLSEVRCCRNFFNASSDSLSTLLCLLSSSSSLPPLLLSSHLSYHSPPISALASLVSSCLVHVTLPLSSVVCHPPSCPAHFSLLLTSLSVKFLCTPVSSLDSTIRILSALVSIAICRTQLFSHTCERKKPTVHTVVRLITDSIQRIPLWQLFVNINTFLISNYETKFPR